MKPCEHKAEIDRVHALVEQLGLKFSDNTIQRLNNLQKLCDELTWAGEHGGEIEMDDAGFKCEECEGKREEKKRREEEEMLEMMGSQTLGSSEDVDME